MPLSLSLAELIVGFWRSAACAPRSQNPSENSSFLLLSVAVSLSSEFKHDHGDGWRKRPSSSLFPLHANELMRIDDCKHIRNAQSGILNSNSWYTFILNYLPMNTLPKKHTHTGDLSININVAEGFHLFHSLIQNFFNESLTCQKVEKVIWYSIK